MWRRVLWTKEAVNVQNSMVEFRTKGRLYTESVKTDWNIVNKLNKREQEQSEENIV